MSAVLPSLLDQPPTQGLILAWDLDGHGGGTPLDWDGVSRWTPPAEAHGAQTGQWVHLDRKQQDVRRWLKGKRSEGGAGVPPLAARALLAEATRPRCQVYGHGVLIVLRGVNLNPGSAPEDMISVRMWVEPGRVISVRQRRLRALNDLSQALTDGHGPHHIAGIVDALASSLAGRMETLLEEIENDLDGAEDSLDGPEVRIDERLARETVQKIRPMVIALRRHMLPQREALSHMLTLNHPALHGMDHEALRETVEQVVRYVESLESSRERALVLKDELSSRQNDRLNQRIYILTLATGVFLPLSFLTGLLGINVGGVPLADSSLGFIVVCALMMCLAAAELWLFRKMRWF
ncbi:zinc transporter ZntB [Insolitispirillum peregrinum]|uniref:zinc transporter ZntB n=1 Tax=Insolitispirillum peregrinum TaxID=80876 RepID=UPI00361B230D